MGAYFHSLNDFKVNGGVPSSVESDHGRVFRALQMGDEALLKDELVSGSSKFLPRGQATACPLFPAPLHVSNEGDRFF